MEDIISKLATQAPLAAALLAGVVWGVKMLIEHMGKPAMHRHFSHLDKNEVHMEKQTEALNSVKNCLERMQEQQSEHIQICRSGSHDPGVRKPTNGGER